nr:ribosomal protein L20 [Cyanidiaceae sp.]
MRKGLKIVFNKIKSRGTKKFSVKSAWMKSLVFIFSSGSELNYILFKSFVVSNFVFLDKKLIAELFVYEIKLVLLLLYWCKVYKLVKRF